MPQVQATADEMRDLLAYLTRLTVDRSPRATLAGTAAADEGTRFADIARPKAGEWPTYHGQLSGNRHSPLDQINRRTWRGSRRSGRFRFPAARGALQVTPVVVGGLMYVTAVNAVWALDARTGRQVWHYSRPRTPGLVGDPASGINRGVAVLGDRVFLQTDHAHLIALHRMTGTAPVGCRDGGLPRALRRDQRAARGQRSGDRRRFRRRRRQSRIPRRIQGVDRRARLAVLDRSRAGRAGIRDMGRQGARARLRRHVADRHLRSGSTAAVLADRQSLSGLQRRRAQGRQPVLELRSCARPRHGQTEVAFPVHAARPSRLGRDRNADARRH